MAENTRQELIDLTQRLLDSIAQADWNTYAELCDPTISCFEPEAHGHLVEGMEFHHYYFNLGAGSTAVNTTLSSPHVRVLGDVAIVSYVRLTQRLNPTGAPMTTAFEETRVWQMQKGHWKHVHFHRSAPA